VPFQGAYEQMTPDEAMARYCLIVDGEFYDGARVKYITKEKAITDEVARRTAGLPDPAQTQLRNMPGTELLRELRYRIKRRFINAFSKV
jgi:phage gp37-like protein